MPIVSGHPFSAVITDPPLRSVLDLPGVAGYWRADLLGSLFTDSALTTPVAVDTDPVGGWVDQSGQGHNLLQATGVLRPLYRTGIINGKPVVRTDGITQFIAATFTLNQPCTMYFVGKMVALPVANADIMTGGAGENGLATSSTQFFVYAGVVLGSITQGTTAHIFGGVLNGASSIRDLDGNRLTGNASTQNPGAVVLGASAAGLTPTNVDFAEAVAFNTALSDDNARKLRALWRAKYGLTGV